MHYVWDTADPGRVTVSCTEYTQLQKLESSFFSLHFGSVKPNIGLYIVLKDTPVPTICPRIRITDRVQGTKGGSENNSPNAAPTQV